MPTLVLLRHGESDWNKENRFTGWTDVDLSLKGREQAKEAGRILREHNLTFDVAYTSVLKRAIRTLWIAMDEMDRMWIPVQNCWRLNERHYGTLQGLSKTETAATFGEEQVKLWRGKIQLRGFGPIGSMPSLPPCGVTKRCSSWHTETACELWLNT